MFHTHSFAGLSVRCPHILSDVLFQGVNVDENAPEISLEFVFKVKVCALESSKMQKKKKQHQKNNKKSIVV